MSEKKDAYPLQWPTGWKRTPAAARDRGKFNTQTSRHSEIVGHTVRDRAEVTIAGGTERVLESLRRMGYEASVVISSNLQLRQDGLPRSGQREPADPGVAVYWGRLKAARCIAVDRYDRVADNLAAIAATLEAMRAIERHGGAAILDRAFTGFVALPAPEQWFTILNVPANATREIIEAAYKVLAMKHHPDRPGGSAAAMSRINTARDDGLAFLQSKEMRS